MPKSTQTRKERYKSEGKYTKPHPFIVHSLLYPSFLDCVYFLVCHPYMCHEHFMLRYELFSCYNHKYLKDVLVEERQEKKNF